MVHYDIHYPFDDLARLFDLDIKDDLRDTSVYINIQTFKITNEVVNTVRKNVSEINRGERVLYTIVNQNGEKPGNIKEFAITWKVEENDLEILDSASNAIKNIVDFDKSDRGITFANDGFYEVRAFMKSKKNNDYHSMSFMQYVGIKEPSNNTTTDMVLSSSIEEIWSVFKTDDELLNFYSRGKDEPKREEKPFFSIKARSFVTPRSFPNIENRQDEEGTMILTVPGDNPRRAYLPEAFPLSEPGTPWEMWLDTDYAGGLEEYGPCKIKTTAYRYVDPWKFEDELWQKDTESAPVRDEGYHIHGGGYTGSLSKSSSYTGPYSPLGNNRYNDTTWGCIRVTNSDLTRMVNFIFKQWDKTIYLEVR
ncbi:hypothetical protein AGMMS49579_22600 [Spirochaetia bacterium]|nr:hypothetical protein AGMMS49579_22600 [Spirochaetia bacterium]